MRSSRCSPSHWSLAQPCSHVITCAWDAPTGVGRAWAAIPIGMFILLIWWSEFGAVPSFWLELALEIAIVTVFTTVIIRFGLLSAVIALTVAKIAPAIPLTLQLSHWSATASNMTLFGILMLALFGFYASRAGRPLFGRLEQWG
jgi:hypothetical protein